VEQFGEIVEVELFEGGKQVFVNRNNREKFVRMFIEYNFQVQCAGQLKSFKKGFERMVDKEVIKTILDS